MIKNYGLRKAEFCIIFVENVINVMWDVRIYRHRRTWQCGILPFATNSPPNKMVDKTNENKQLYIKIIERKHHRISNLAANLVHFCIAKLNWIVILMRALASMWFAFEFIFLLLEIKWGCIQIWEIIYRSQWIKLNSTKKKLPEKGLFEVPIICQSFRIYWKMEKIYLIFQSINTYLTVCVNYALKRKN